MYALFHEDEQGQMWIGSEEGVYIATMIASKDGNCTECETEIGLHSLLCKINNENMDRDIGRGVYVVDANHKQLTRSYDGNRLRTNNINQIY